VFLFLVAWIALLPCERAHADTTEETARTIGTAVQLLVDDWLIESTSNSQLVMHPPVRREEVFVFDAPWEGVQSAYVTVMQVDSGYRMYYRAGGDLTREYVAMAVSDDGIHWTRPTLGLFEYNYTTTNNIIWSGEKKAYWECHNFAPFIDENPAAPVSEKFKAVTLSRRDYGGVTKKILMGFVSADGIHWRRIQEDPIITEGAFDSHNTAFWDVTRGEYVCYLRNGRDGFRQIMRATSSDFINWTDPEWLEYGDAPLEQFYTNGIIAYPDSPGLYLGFPMRFVRERTTVWYPPETVDALSDGVMMSSHDGLNFHRPFMEAFIRPGLLRINWGSGHGNQTPAWGILQTSPEETSVYWLEQYNIRAQPYHVPVLRRGTVRRDGFASMNAPFEGGEFLTRPIAFGGRNLIVNYSTSAVGSLRVEIQDTDGNPRPGYELASCLEIYGDELERTVRWTGGPDLEALIGVPVRLRFVMKDADLYSLRFAPATASRASVR
jgi:hypothetical protein